MKFKNILVMGFIAGGTLIMKGGALLFGFKTFLITIVTNNQTIVWVGSLVAFLSAGYVIAFTRGAMLWKGIFSSNKLSSLEKNYDENVEKQLQKVGIIGGFIAIFSGIGLIPVLSYIGTKEILDLFQINYRIIFYIFFIYCLISDYIAYLSFTTRITIENTKNFYLDLFVNKNNFSNFPLCKTLIVTLLGFLSNMSFNYFLARNVLSSITANTSLIISISAIIAVSSAIVTFLSKSGNVYLIFTNKQKINAFALHHPTDKIMLFSHRIVGLCYLLCFGFAYYIACIQNFIYFGGDIYNVNERIPLEIIAVFTAMSATYMEFALSYKAMIEEFVNRARRLKKINDSSEYISSNNTNS